MAKLRKCCIDGTEYEFCQKCNSKIKPDEMWRTSFCSENCRDIFNVCNKYANSNLNATDAASALAQLDISKLELFPNGVKGNIADILATPVEEEVPYVRKHTKHTEDI